VLTRFAATRGRFFFSLTMPLLAYVLAGLRDRYDIRQINTVVSNADGPPQAANCWNRLRPRIRFNVIRYVENDQTRT